MEAKMQNRIALFRDYTTGGRCRMRKVSIEPGIGLYGKSKIPHQYLFRIYGWGILCAKTFAIIGPSLP